VIVLDASALLALVTQEPGWEVVTRAAAGDDATISAVNYSEVLQKTSRVGIAAEEIESGLDELDTEPFPVAGSWQVKPDTPTSAR
jgi:ribonuclease VapC